MSENNYADVRSTVVHHSCLNRCRPEIISLRNNTTASPEIDSRRPLHNLSTLATWSGLYGAADGEFATVGSRRGSREALLAVYIPSLCSVSTAEKHVSVIPVGWK